jgi:serine/threonine-protein kinase
MEGPAPRKKVDSDLPQIDGYDVEAILGRGGMGVVFRARQHKLKRLVAVKTLLPGAYPGAQELARFRREAEAVAVLRHPNIVQVHDVGEMAGQPYFTMELVEGGSLAQKIAGTPQPVRQAAELVATLASAVQFAHQSGIMHRDLKPANILLATDGTPKITDFGLARSIQEGPRLTLTGARLGTPSYMAPEQALGKTSALGPAVDIYALGAVLYELLTGKPPFEGPTAAETERRVIYEEPVPPSRSNVRVPRDLETICLKCLQKNPPRRYASAQDLADDLHRFLDGKPVLARPVGALERTVKWTRRRPAFATLLAALFVLVAATAAVSLWRQSETAERQDRARRAIKIAIQGAYESGRAERWPEALRILEDAATHLTDADSDELRQGLAQARSEVQFAQQLEHIREKGLVLLAEKSGDPTFTFTLLAEDSRSAFAQAGYNIDGPAQETVARIQASPLAVHTVAGLDEWAYAAFVLNRAPLQQQLLQIAQLVDPDPSWRDRFRTPATWHDKQALRQLADDAFKAPVLPAAHHLAITGALLRTLGDTSTDVLLLRQGWLHHPGDFWLNWHLANRLVGNKQHAEAVEHYRVVVALRPENVWTHCALALALGDAGQHEEGITQLQMAVAREPRNGLVRYFLVSLLSRAGRIGEAQTECQKGIEANPGDAWAPYGLGMILDLENRPEEAITPLQKACQLDPKWVGAHHNLGVVLRKSGRLEEALAAFQNSVALAESNPLGHLAVGFTLLDLGRCNEAIPEFEWLIRELDPKKKRPDADLGNGLDTKYIHAWIGKFQSLVCLGRFTEAKATAEKAKNLPRPTDVSATTLIRQLEVSEGLAPLEAELPAILAGAKQPPDLAAQLLLAEWLYKYKRFAAASVSWYESAFAKVPGLANNLNARYRYHAACAAALAGCGLGKDAAKLNDKEKAALRGKALAWLTKERDDWEIEQQSATVPVQSIIAGKVREWEKDEDLWCVRDPKALAKLPEGERAGWKKLWTEVKALVLRDPLTTLAKARQYVDEKEWAKAAKIYALFTKDTSPTDGEVWFEYAAVQWLSGDYPGYRQTCKHMLQGAPKTPKFRPYLIARVCTLAPDSVEDAALPAEVSGPELKLYATEFWSLTEQGALLVRSKQYHMAVELFRLSLEANEKPGAKVLNWLWLALAHQKLGAKGTARD